MESPVFTHQDVFVALGNAFYEVVPVQYRTYCALNAKICQSALQHFGIDSAVIPCEIWYVDAEQNYVIGVIKETVPTKWPGHAICLTEGYLIDAALYHFKREFDIDVPSIVVCKTFGIASNVIARQDLGTMARLWWHRTPADVQVPNEPAGIVEEYSIKLAKRVKAVLAERAVANSLQKSSDNLTHSSVAHDQ